MDANEIVKGLCAEIRTLESDLSYAKYTIEKLNNDIAGLEEHNRRVEEENNGLKDAVKGLHEENKTLKLKIDDMSKEF